MFQLPLGQIFFLCHGRRHNCVHVLLISDKFITRKTRIFSYIFSGAFNLSSLFLVYYATTFVVYDYEVSQPWSGIF